MGNGQTNQNLQTTQKQKLSNIFPNSYEQSDESNKSDEQSNQSEDQKQKIVVKSNTLKPQNENVQHKLKDQIIKFRQSQLPGSNNNTEKKSNSSLSSSDNDSQNFNEIENSLQYDDKLSIDTNESIEDDFQFEFSENYFKYYNDIVNDIRNSQPNELEQLLIQITDHYKSEDIGYQNLYKQKINKFKQEYYDQRLQLEIERSQLEYKDKENYVEKCSKIFVRSEASFDQAPKMYTLIKDKKEAISIDQLYNYGMSVSSIKGSNSSQQLNKTNYFVYIDQEIKFLTVLDGHGLYGTQISQLTKKLIINKFFKNPLVICRPNQVLQTIYQQLSQTLKKYIQESNSCNFNTMLSGCSSTSIIQYQNKIYVTHIGDSKAFVFKKSNYISKNKKHYTQITTNFDLIEDDQLEKIRIYKNGGEIKK